MAQMKANEAYYAEQQQMSYGPAGYPYQGDAGRHPGGQAKPGSGASTPNRVRSWADAAVESEDELNSQSSAPSFPWISSGRMPTRQDSQSSALSCSGQSRSHSMSSESPQSQHSYSGSGQDVARKNIVKKLRNRALTKDQLAENKTMGRQSQGDMSGFSSDDATPTSAETSTIFSTVESSSESFQDHTGQIVSLGSARHDFGECKPCLFVNTNVGCQNGSGCEFCHFTHKRKSKPRPCKGKRDRYRKLLTRMEQNAGVGADGNVAVIDAASPADSTEFGSQALTTVIAI